MIQNLRIIIIVAMRLFALFTMGSGLFLSALAVLMSSKSDSMPLGVLAVYMGLGLILWFLAKPCADIATHGLDEE